MAKCLATRLVDQTTASARPSLAVAASSSLSSPPRFFPSIAGNPRHLPGSLAPRSGRASERQCFSIARLHCPQARFRKTSFSYRSQPAQQIYKNPLLPHVDGSSGPSSSSSGLVDCIHRPPGRLLARSGGPPLSEIPSSANRDFGLSVPGDALRSQYRSEGIHQAGKSGSRDPSRKGRVQSDVSGRLASSSSDGGSLPAGSSGDPGRLSGIRPQGQPSEVVPPAFPIPRLAGNVLEHAVRDPITISRQRSTNMRSTTSGAVLEDDVQASVGSTPRLPQLCGRSASFRSVTSSSTHSGGQSVLPSLPSGPGSPVSQILTSPPSPMATSGSSLTRSPMDPPRATVDRGIRRVRMGLGLPIQRRPPSPGTVASPSSDTSYQRSGTSCAPSVSTTGPLLQHQHTLPDRQPGSCVLHQQTGIPISRSTRDLRVSFLARRETQDPDIGPISSRGDQSVGGRPIQDVHLLRGVDPGPGDVQRPVPSVGYSGHRPLRLLDQSSSSPLSHSLADHPSRGSGCSLRGVEQVAVHLSVSSSVHVSHAPSGQTSPLLPRAGTSHCPTLGGPTLGPGTSRVVSQPPSSSSGQHYRPGDEVIRDILRFSRVEFLSRALEPSLSERVIHDLHSSLRPSSTRQYESAWKKFQTYLRQHDPPAISQGVVLDFLSYLFHDLGLSSPTVASHWSAIAEPLRVACNLMINERILTQQRRGFFIQRPAPRRPPPSWSLQRVLDSLSSSPNSHESIFRRALFLTAMASGLRVSQLHALTRHPSLTYFSDNDSSVSLAPSPRFLAKNEREGHRLEPFIIPAWLGGGARQSLCPVLALRSYINDTSNAPLDHLFVFPRSGKACSRRQIVNLLKEIIIEGDPGSQPQSRDLRSFSASLAYFRLFDVDRTQVQGQWKSSHSFCNNYFKENLPDVPCVAMGTLPSL